MDNKYEYATWERCEDVIDLMEFNIKTSGYKIDTIYAIPRGGCVLGVMLSHKLNIPVQFNNDFVSNKTYLIIDDIADTGKTLEPYVNMPNKLIFTWYYHEQSTVIPDFYVDTKYNEWIVYPWEI